MTWTSNGGRTSTTAHKQRRRRVLERDNHQCQIRGPKCIGTATECDHIINVKAFGNQPELAETDENCRAACHPCHANKSALEGVQARAKRRAKLKLPVQKHPGLR